MFDHNISMCTFLILIATWLVRGFGKAALVDLVYKSVVENIVG